MAILDDVQLYLIAQSIGTDPSNQQPWPIFKGYMPDDPKSPDRALSLYELPGREAPDQWNVLYPRIVVYARGETDYDYATARQKLYDAVVLLHATTTEVGPTYRSFIMCTSAPVFLGYDSKRRPKLSWSLDVIHQT